jgi:hypothetical protein
MKTKLYLAYGSNLNLGQMGYRCPDSKMAGKAELPGYRLLFRGRPHNAHATIERSEGGNVPVLLWKVSVRDEACLDLYEGFPRYYGKVNLPVELDGKTVTAMAYVMQPGFDCNEPSLFYLDTIREGYRAAGFDQTVLDKALMETRQEMHPTFTIPLEKILQKQRDFEVEYAHNSTALAGNSLTLEQTRAVLDAVDPPPQLSQEPEDSPASEEESPKQTM